MVILNLKSQQVVDRIQGVVIARFNSYSATVWQLLKTVINRGSFVLELHQRDLLSPSTLPRNRAEPSCL